MFVPCVQCPLRQKPLFRPFSDLELDFVAEMKTEHVVIPPRVDIIREDEVGGPVYTLFEGWAVRYHRLRNGERQVLDVVLPGDLIGLASAITGTVRHSVQALTPVSLCVLEGKRFSELFERYPGMALNLLKTRIEEEQRADVRLSLLGRSTAEQRVSYFMLEIFDRLHARGMVDRGSTCPFPLQRRDLADTAGIAGARNTHA